MILISHRGNINGKNEERENSPDYIDEAIDKDYDVEVDVWMEDGFLYLGHDEPQYRILQHWLEERVERLWIHCKNFEAMRWFTLIGGFNHFWHQEDDFTLTSIGAIWTYPGKELTPRSICVLPELNNDNSITMLPKELLGICSDYIINYKNEDVI